MVAYIFRGVVLSKSDSSLLNYILYYYLRQNVGFYIIKDDTCDINDKCRSNIPLDTHSTLSQILIPLRQTY